MSNIDDYIKVVPNRVQRLAQRYPFNVFIHFGMTTFTGKEWGDGKTPASEFNPTALDARQWAKTAADAGANGVVLTCKHHDGFCLWPTDTTDYCVKNSPYKDGKGDVVGELAAACAEEGLRFGVYLSPWDRHEPCYATADYNDFYCAQLRELLTRYGKISYVWLDGACGSYLDDKPKQEYDFDRYFAIIRELQPDCAISNCGPDVRWVGNEAGVARKSEFNVVPRFECDIQTIADKSQKADTPEFARKRGDIVNQDLGSRSFLAQYDEFMWYPAEVDVSIRPGWFYHASQDVLVKSVDTLEKIYYGSVLGNNMLLLNIPPDTRGLMNDNDVATCRALGEYIRSFDAKRIAPVKFTAPPAKKGFEAEKALCYSFSTESGVADGCYSPAKEAESYEFTFDFGTPRTINRFEIIEDTSFSQRIESFKVYVEVDGRRKKVFDGTVVGYRKVGAFKPVAASKAIVVIDCCRREPYIEFACFYEDDGFVLKKRPFEDLLAALHALNYKVYISRENSAKARIEAKRAKIAAKAAAKK